MSRKPQHLAIQYLGRRLVLCGGGGQFQWVAASSLLTEHFRLSTMNYVLTKPLWRIRLEMGYHCNNFVYTPYEQTTWNYLWNEISDMIIFCFPVLAEPRCQHLVRRNRNTDVAFASSILCDDKVVVKQLFMSRKAIQLFSWLKTHENGSYDREVVYLLFMKNRNKTFLISLTVINKK